ncbi:MAG: enoyl-CoA hydratase/isomerase family protein [Candidatus Aenigmarchaeota archaeon]|nr:enoyl-CoA hydratase/isomerase family protein [Candidatus Aenigmarchaeota archaeon]
MHFKNIGIATEEGIGTLTLNRPEKLNAINSGTWREIDSAFEEFGKDDYVKAVVVTGKGKAFSAGGDLEEMSGFEHHSAWDFAILAHRVLSRIENFPKPVIAAINGFALGAGNEIAMACDFRIASKAAKFGHPEVKIGIPPGAGATIRLPHFVGAAKAKEMIYTGKIITAQEALEIGLADRIAADPVKEAKLLARQMLENSLSAIANAKMLINKFASIDEAKTMAEIRAFAKAFGTPDQKEGMRAFLEKRKPRFGK